MMILNAPHTLMNLSFQSQMNDCCNDCCCIQPTLRFNQNQQETVTINFQHWLAEHPGFYLYHSSSPTNNPNDIYPNVKSIVDINQNPQYILLPTDIQLIVNSIKISNRMFLEFTIKTDSTAIKGHVYQINANVAAVDCNGNLMYKPFCFRILIGDC